MARKERTTLLGDVAPVPYAVLEKNYYRFSETLSKVVRSGALAIIAAIWAIFTAEGIRLAPSAAFEIQTQALVRASFVLVS